MTDASRADRVLQAMHPGWSLIIMWPQGDHRPSPMVDAWVCIDCEGNDPVERNASEFEDARDVLAWISARECKRVHIYYGPDNSYSHRMMHPTNSPERDLPWNSLHAPWRIAVQALPSKPKAPKR